MTKRDWWNRTGIAGASAHCLTWAVAYLLVESAMGHSSARGGYGLLVGWWAALYVGYIGRVDLRAVPALSALVVLGRFFSTNVLSMSAADPLYATRDGFVVLAVQILAFVSPVFLNELVRAVLRRFNQ
jgi:hypothetical protein